MANANQNSSIDDPSEVEESIADVFRDLSPMTTDSYKKDIRRSNDRKIGLPSFAIFAVIVAILAVMYFLMAS